MKQMIPMNEFDEFLSRVLPKIGPNAAFDLAREAKFSALEKLLIDKGVCTKEEFDLAMEESLKSKADMIERMPPIPKQ